VSLLQQVSCSFAETAFLNGYLGSLGARLRTLGPSGQSILSRIRPRDLFAAAHFVLLACANTVTHSGGFFSLGPKSIKGIVMKSQRPTPAKLRTLSDAILANRYLDLQRLRDEVRKAESTCTPRSSKKASVSPFYYPDRSARSSVRPGNQKVVDFHSRP
jgi:hypothetical protein